MHCMIDDQNPLMMLLRFHPKMKNTHIVIHDLGKWRKFGSILRGVQKFTP